MPYRQPRHRPPWWPENEEWPPTRPWRAGRRHFGWRIATLFIVMILVVVSGCTTLLWLLSSIFNPIERASPPIGPIIGVGLFLFVFFGMFSTGRALHRATRPIEDVMDAASRVTQGDYSVRVEEYGPREVRALARSFNAMTERLQVHDEQRRNLLADVTHELRTPLTVIQGNLEGMLDGIYPADRGHIESILEETRVLSRVIDDLRTLSLAESGRLKLEIESTDIGALVRDAAASFQTSAAQAEITVNVEVGSNLPLIDIDATRIREVLTNLLINALRYTPRGGHIDARCTNAADRIEVSIRDTGRGIAPEDLPHVFDRFYKGSDSRGTGLGLAIARSLVTAHGGEISARSDWGHGTTITFTLPVKNVSP